MRKDRQLGLDELMIVNPSSSGTEAMFLGEDGTLYQVQGLGEEKAQKEWGNAFWAKMVRCIRCKASTRRFASPQNSDENLGEEDGHELGQYFLGADGALYEVVR